MPWQRFFCQHALGQQVDAARWRWAAFEVLLLVSRQNGKGTDIEIVELYVLFSLGLNVYHTAQLMETSRKASKRLLLLIERTPQLRRRVRDIQKTADKVHIELTSGAFITFMARSTRAGRGFDDADVLVFDEAMFLEPRMTEAVIPAMSTRPTPLVIYASSAGLADSALLRALRKRLLAKDPTIAGFDWSVDPDALKDPAFDPLALEVVAQANPSLGGLITMEYVRGEFAAMTSTGSLQGFYRERLGIFDADPAEAKRVIPAAAWADRAGAAGAPDGPVAFGVAAAWPDAESAAIAVAGRLGGELVVQVIEHHAGTSWVLPRLRELVDRHDAPVVIDPGGPAGHLVADIADEDLEPGQDEIEVLTPTMRQVGYASKDLLAAVDGDLPSLRHFDQPELNAAVAGAARRTLGDLWTWQRRGDADISPLEAVTLAAWGAGQLAPPPPPPRSLGGSTTDRSSDLNLIGF
ncbi:MAG: hypothetical protein EPO40_03180 [Myxococcaceae bacterium]|nr:MAG: hypothetical protein EPO40_03180 [Myxococcaceae bacterium]